jgi:hypothetical protein
MFRTVALLLGLLVISQASIAETSDSQVMSPAPWVQAQGETKADTQCGPAPDQTCDSYSEICCNRSSAYWYCCARNERCGSFPGDCQQ